MPWFTAVLIVKSSVGDSWQDDHLIDHQVRVISAEDADQAYEKAMKLGADEEHS